MAETPSASDRQAAQQAACLSGLRQNDLDRYLSCLLIEEPARSAIAAIYAFNAEIARVRDVVHDALPGEVRYQWWRDLLEGQERGDVTGHPVAACLLDAIQTFDLPKATLVNLIEARIFDLYDDPMPSTADLEGYAGETASALIQLATMVLAPEKAASLSDVAGHAGVAQCVAGLLLLMPLHRHRGQLYLPLDILAATGLDRDTFLQGGDKARISAAISAFVGFGRDHLEKARLAAATQPLGPAIGAYLPVSLSAQVFDKAASLGAEILEKPFQPAQWRRQWRLWQSARRGRF